MRITKFTLIIISFTLLNACVSKKRFLELVEEKDHLALIMEKNRMDLQDQINELQVQNLRLSQDKEIINKEISNLEDQLDDTDQKVKQVEFNLQDKQYQISQIWNEMDMAFSEVEQAVASSNQRIKEMENFLYLDLDELPSFDPGSDEFKNNSAETLQQIVKMLKENPKVNLVIEGHTDSKPVNNKEFTDNWDLSVSRSTQIIRELVKLGANPEQLIAAGRGEYMPKVEENPNDPKTAEANRRTEFILVPNIGKLYKINKNKLIKP